MRVTSILDQSGTLSKRSRHRYAIGLWKKRSTPRLAISRVFAMACAALFVAGSAHADDFPSRPIKIFVGYGPGGGTDTLSRFYGAKLQEVLGTAIVVENKPGASEILAAQPVMNSQPDGYTVWMGTAGGLAQNPGIRKDLPYNILKNFTPIALIAEAEAVVVVKPGVPVSSLAELVAYGKSNPGKLNYGTGGIGSGNHLQMEYLMSLTGASFTHVPYKSEVEITRDMMAGSVDLSMLTAQIALPLVNEGKLKPLAVTGTQRLKSMPTVPSVSESGVSELQPLGSYTFFGVVGPAGMPASVVRKLNEAFNKVSSMPDVDQRLRETMQVRPKAVAPGDFRQVLERELGKWRELSKTVKVGTT